MSIKLINNYKGQLSVLTTTISRGMDHNFGYEIHNKGHVSGRLFELKLSLNLDPHT